MGLPPLIAAGVLCYRQQHQSLAWSLRLLLTFSLILATNAIMTFASDPNAGFWLRSAPWWAGLILGLAALPLLWRRLPLWPRLISAALLLTATAIALAGYLIEPETDENNSGSWDYGSMAIKKASAYPADTSV
jgi:hypothetical protein